MAGSIVKTSSREKRLFFITGESRGVFRWFFSIIFLFNVAFFLISIVHKTTVPEQSASNVLVVLLEVY